MRCLLRSIPVGGPSGSVSRNRCLLNEGQAQPSASYYVFYRSPRARIGCDYVTCLGHVTTSHTSHTNNTARRGPAPLS
eukprot:3852515-Prymnesium_polylepis.1